MKELTIKEKELFWREFRKHLREAPSPFPEIMLDAYYQKQLYFIRRQILRK